VIIDLPRFIQHERETWNELERILNRLESDPGFRMNVDEAMRFHALYQKTAAGLARISTFSSERELRRYLETLVARAYSEIHETRASTVKLNVVRLFLDTFPAAFRRRFRAFALATAVFCAGGLFGGFAVLLDDEAKAALVPPMFGHLLENPAKRVAEEEKATEDRLRGAKGSFSSMLMTHNIRVSILVMALGITFGVGTFVVLFANGVILGLVAADYIAAGQTAFLFGWLLPHGIIEIPAVLIGGQAGLVLGGALIGRGDRTPMRERLRSVRGDVSVLVFGLALLLVWAGIVEAFLSQYHAPVLPYAVKIGFGIIEGLLLVLLLSRKPTTR
jgi:uncharacterized membrane protein SpoIIM required for sporulation